MVSAAAVFAALLVFDHQIGAAKKATRYGKTEKTGNGLPPPVPSHEFALTIREHDSAFVIVPIKVIFSGSRGTRCSDSGLKRT
jgi:hypothetical protein